MIMPLWQESRKSLVAEVIQKGYTAVIISIDRSQMNSKYLGATLTRELISQLEAEGIDASAEGGEFHSLIISGPLLRKSLRFITSKQDEDEKHLFLDVKCA
jgi:diphthamide synthase (EF-2-diphthine--ammonia ligase)